MTAAPIGFEAGAGGWTYAWDHRRKPHVHPLATPAGVVLTRVEPPDHPWQRGRVVRREVRRRRQLLGGVRPRGLGGRSATTGPRSARRHRGRPPRLDPPRPHDRGGARAPRAAPRPADDDAYALDWDVTLTLPRRARRRARPTPYMGVWGGYSGLALRGREDWVDTRLVLDDGGRAAGWRRSRRAGATCRARPTAGRSGVCVLDHPGQPRPPGAVLRHHPRRRRLRRRVGQHDLPRLPVARTPPARGRRRRCGSATAWPCTTAPGTPTACRRRQRWSADIGGRAEAGPTPAGVDGLRRR